MLSIPTRRVVHRQLFRTVQACRNYSSTPKPNFPAYKSNIARAAAAGLVLSIPAGFLVQKSYNDVPQTSSLSEFHIGSLDWKGKSVRQFGLEDVEAWLRENESSKEGPSGSGVTKWYTATRPSNARCEDNLVVAQCPVSGDSATPWLFWGIFDGHSGSATSAVLREALVPYVVRSLSALFQSFTGKIPRNALVDEAIMSSFCQLDDEIKNDGAAALQDAKTLTEALSRLAPSYAGSCAILSMFDPNTKLLRVASTGDCRAVLVHRDPESGKYIATALSEDQTGKNESELARITAEHPGEEGVVNLSNGRTFGLAPSRAFGDMNYKWPLEVIKECRAKFFGPRPLNEYRDFPEYKTPPYITAKPVVTTTEIRGKGNVLVMASDGFWDHISTDQSGELIGMWITARESGDIGKGPRKPFPIPTKAKGITDDEDRMKNENFVVEDDNVATHLVRNAFGGKDIERLCGVVGAQPPLARRVRDDITVKVVFFGDDE